MTSSLADSAPTQAAARAEAGAADATRPRRVSVVVPVRNEEASITRLLDSLLAQSLAPAEIVITDGGSTDRTRELVRRRADSADVPLVLVEAGEALPGRGRNLAIARAAHEWVACIDAGIVPDRDWLRELVATAEREPQASVIYGRYEAVTDTYFAECAAILYAPPPGTLTRSIASCLMRRGAWEAAGRFREDLRSGEDLLFFKRLEAAGVGAAYCRGAVVHWSLQPTSRDTFRKMRVYSRHNMRAGLAAEWQRSVARLYALMLAFVLAGLCWWWPLALVPVALLVARAARRIQRWYAARGRRRMLAELCSPRRVLTVVWINLVIDAAMFLGVWDWWRQDRARTRD